MIKELLIGCGSRRVKHLQPDGEGWHDLTTLDINPDHRPDVEWDLENLPLPFPDNSFDQIHAYEVLEHTGRQGDYRFFLAQFEDFWRILRPDGLLCGSVPHQQSSWVWGDPGHTRTILLNSFVFLDQSEYTKQVGVTALSDYRHWYSGDFRPYGAQMTEESLFFLLQAVKPSRKQ